MPKNLVPDIDWQSLIWSDVKRPIDSRINSENAFSNFPVGGKLDFIKGPQVWEFHGNERFYRFGNPASILKFDDPGAWWVDEQTYLKCDQDARQLGTSFPEHYRASFAVSRDWSDLKNLYELTVPIHQKILGVFGETKYQPEFSIKSTAQSNVIFFGRGKQIFFRGEDLKKFKYSIFRTF